MWVRTQNKLKIMDVRIITLIHEDNEYVILGATDSEAPLDELGSYSTHEKAFKVLDKIQTHLLKSTQLTRLYNIFSEEYTNDYNIGNKLFQMPLDCEVLGND